MVKKLDKGCEVMVNWIPSYYRGYKPPSKGTVVGKENFAESYMKKHDKC